MIKCSSCLVEDGDFTAKYNATSLLSRLVDRHSVIISVRNNPHASIRRTHAEIGPDQYLRVV